MADFYSILARAVDALDSNTKEARAGLYERARIALLAETQGPHPALNESEFMAALGFLEEAVQKLEAEAQREDRVQRAGAATSPSTAMPDRRQRAPQFMPFLTRAFRLGRDSARNALRRPADREELPSDTWSELAAGHGRDGWLSNLLARASRDEHESHDGGVRRRDARRNR
jgi:hypothetical protein